MRRQARVWIAERMQGKGSVAQALAKGVLMVLRPRVLECALSGSLVLFPFLAICYGGLSPLAALMCVCLCTVGLVDIVMRYTVSIMGLKTRLCARVEKLVSMALGYKGVCVTKCRWTSMPAVLIGRPCIRAISARLAKADAWVSRGGELNSISAKKA